MKRSMTFLDGSGDVTIVWDEDTDEKMLKLVEDRMAAGYVFYILKPRMIPMLPPKKVKARNVDEVREAGSITILDADIHQLFVNGDITTTRTSDNLEVVSKAANSNQVVEAQSVAVRPARGG